MTVAYTGNWSFSWLMKYEQCAFMFKLAKIERLPEPPRPPDNPLERGNRIHKALEDYVTGKSSTPDSEARKLAPIQHVYDHMRMLYTHGMVTVEQDWFFDHNWEVCDRKDVWLWVKLDTCVLDESQALVIPGDTKSGKSGYKAVEHVQQLQIYSATSAIKFPWANTLAPELYYVDEGHIRQTEMSREHALSFIGRFDQRAQRIYDDRMFRPNPSAHTCRYCSYSPRGTGACPVGV